MKLANHGVRGIPPRGDFFRVIAVRCNTDSGEPVAMSGRAGDLEEINPGLSTLLPRTLSEPGFSRLKDCRD